ncbi:hypothetical protein BN1013_00577 [Candidatus Rubidus massiliensis]|nr:hypothetical protein BN1013_00577 [Candidatus Rubidus massiliensis]
MSFFQVPSSFVERTNLVTQERNKDAKLFNKSVAKTIAIAAVGLAVALSPIGVFALSAIVATPIIVAITMPVLSIAFGILFKLIDKKTLFFSAQVAINLEAKRN